MIPWKLTFAIILHSLSLSIPLKAQRNPIAWQITADSSTSQETLVQFVAIIQPGWHLYSQFMDDGGPVPTHFSFNATKDFSLSGPVAEVGSPTTFFDENYGCKVTWYQDKVTFAQKIKLHARHTNLTGRIEYMLCNDQVCVPGKHDFGITVKRN